MTLGQWELVTLLSNRTVQLSDHNIIYHTKITNVNSDKRQQNIIYAYGI